MITVIATIHEVPLHLPVLLQVLHVHSLILFYKNTCMFSSVLPGPVAVNCKGEKTDFVLALLKLLSSVRDRQ